MAEQQGFTLIEALVAFVVLGLALTALYGQFFGGFTALRTSDSVAAATRLAQSKLEPAGISEPLRPGETSGRFGNGFTWRKMVAPYRGELVLPRYDAVAPYAVAVTVSWPAFPKDKAVTLSAVRLAPLPAGGPR
jgi:prepilin-type N-terminal cleavage/methylation domain-containing protein